MILYETDEFIQLNENKFCSKLTGETFTKEEVRKLKEYESKKIAIENTKELNELGIESNLVIFNYKNRDYQCVSIKKGHSFNKFFRVDWRDMLEEVKLSRNAKAFLFSLMPYLHFPTNSIMYKGGIASIKDLEEISDFKKASVYNIINELEEKEIIKRVKKNIYFNPFLISSGAIVIKETYDLFKGTRYNPDGYKEIRIQKCENTL